MATTSPPPLEDKINFTFDIHIMKSILYSIHSTDLIHRQPTEAQRATYANRVSLLEKRLSKTEHELQKRESCGKRLQRLLTCRDKDYTSFVKLSCDLREVYSTLLLNATPTPPTNSHTPGSSVGSSKSGSSSDRGLWMRDPAKAGKRSESASEQGTDEQIEESTLEIRVIPPTPLLKISNKSSSSSTIRASRVNPPMTGGEEVTIDDQIAEWMKGSKGRQGKLQENEDENLLQADF